MTTNNFNVQLNSNSYEASDLLHCGIIEFAKIERNGIHVDMNFLQNSKKNITKQIKEKEEKFRESKFYKNWQKVQKEKVNTNSDPQLRFYLYHHLGYKPSKKTKTNQGSTDRESLQQLNIPEINLLLEIRKLKKIRDTYLAQLERETVDGIMHPFFNLHTTRTFRSSSDLPNFQNFPIRDEEAMQLIRGCIIPRPGHQLLELDYGQLEVRIAACYNKDKKLIDDIIHGDMHRDMAVEIFKIKNFDKSKKGHSHLRKGAKNGFVFPEFYGDYWKPCAESLACKWGGLSERRWKPGQGIEFEDEHLSDHLIRQGLNTYKKFQNHIRDIENDFWYNRYSTYSKWKTKFYKDYQKNGYFDTYTGFRLQGLMTKKDVINYPVQGAAFHCLLWSLIEINQMLVDEERDSKIIGQIHDSIVFDIDPKELQRVIEIAKYAMTERIREVWKWIIVPLEIEAELCDIDQPWSTKKEFKI